MKAPKDFLWPLNLYEAGQPIKEEAREIDQHLVEIKTARVVFECKEAEALVEVRNRYTALEKRITELWSAEDIAAAKQGKTRDGDHVWDGPAPQ